MGAVSIEVEKADGEMVSLTCDKITKEMMVAVEETQRDAPSISFYKQMAIFFGGKPEDYEWIDVRTVAQVIHLMADQIKSVPTGRQGA
jgi:hypothetical protein